MASATQVLWPLGAPEWSAQVSPWASTWITASGVGHHHNALDLTPPREFHDALQVFHIVVILHVAAPQSFPL
jgi:hypothetical protein